MRRLVPDSIRVRLVLAISAVSAVALVASFFALHEATGSELRGNIDEQLFEQSAEFEQAVSAEDVSTPARLEKAARQFVSSQRYHPESRIFAIQVAGGPVVTNQREIVESELEDEEEDADEEASATGVLEARDGLSTLSTEETGRLRVLTVPIESGNRTVGTLRVADPLNSVDQALEELRNTFLIVGALTLAFAVAIAIWLANLISGPLRRIAGVASDVDSGDLSHRIEYDSGGELGVLADAFNGMLDRLEGAFRRQREFVSDASHELRSPLTVLRGRIETLLRRRGVSEEARDEMQSLLREVSRMDRLIDDMLTLARAERGTLLETRVFPLKDLIEDVRRDLPLLGARDYRVEGNPGGTLEGDPDRLAQVLRNLVSNAVRHSGEKGTVVVSVTARNGDARFAVKDDGPGIPPEQLDRIFDRFYRTDEGRTRDDGGSGLGLAIARAIVRAHGGEITAESKPGAGATISFEVPGYLAPGRGT